MEFNAWKSIKQPIDVQVLSAIDVIDGKVANTME